MFSMTPQMNQIQTVSLSCVFLGESCHYIHYRRLCSTRQFAIHICCHHAVRLSGHLSIDRSSYRCLYLTRRSLSCHRIQLSQSRDSIDFCTNWQSSNTVEKYVDDNGKFHLTMFFVIVAVFVH
jgi:hypothetical protein